KQVHPNEQLLIARLGVDVAAHLLHPRRPFEELLLLVLEAEVGLFERREALAVDEEHRWRVERRRAVAVGPKQARPGLRIGARALQQQWANVFAREQRCDRIRGMG